MNVLLTSISRKVWLVQAFQRAFRPRGAKVFAADLDPLAAGLRFSDGVVLLPRLDDPSFEGALYSLCREREITAIVPTRDAELGWFAARREALAAVGITVLISAPDAVETCQDKRAFVEHCRARGFPVAEDAGDPPVFPLFARPRRSSGGRGAHVVEDAGALAGLMPAEWVIQRRVAAPEYTIDVYVDRNGRALTAVPRLRLRVVGGESVVGETVDAPALVEGAVALVASLGLVGHITLQAFLVDGCPRWIEINPRFGGGAALGFAAGADTPALFAAELAGEELSPRIDNYVRGVRMYRYATDLFIQEEP